MGTELEDSYARYHAHLAQQAAAAQEHEGKKGEQQAFLDRVAETRARIARGEAVTTELKSPVQMYSGIYSAAHAEQQAQAMQQRKEKTAASKDVRNVPSWLVARLPPGDALRAQSKLMQVNPEDYT